MARRPRTGLLTNYKVAPQTPSTVVGRPATPVTKKKGKAPEQTYTTQTTGMLSPVAVAPAAPAGNITGRPVATPSKPAPTPPKQTAPVGTPSSDPVKTQPGETGPFDPNAPVPTPAPAPQQTAPAASWIVTGKHCFPVTIDACIDGYVGIRCNAFV